MDISVVTAVHNGEKYLRETLDSILSQTFGNFEVIIIDDFSTDKTPEILAEYAKKDDRINGIIITILLFGFLIFMNFFYK